MKQWKKRGSMFLGIALCVVISMNLSKDTYAISYSSITSDSIKDKENQIAAAQNEKDELQNNLSDVKKIKEDLEKVKNNLSAYVAELDGSLNTIEEKIIELDSMISDKEAEIAETEAELAEASAVEQEQYESMKQRIQYMYEQGDTYYIELLVGSESFSDMINRADYIEMLSEYDKKKLDEYSQTTQFIALCKEQLDEQKVILDEAKAAQETERAALETLVVEKEQQINAYESDINNKEAAIAEYEAYISEQNEIITMLEAAVAEEKKSILAANGLVLTYDGGTFAWPCPAYKSISSDYGTRMHPTLGIQQFHNGVDMAAPAGSDILAAYSGVVVAAAYSNTMGNYIMIDHGDGLYTIYMHASKLYVSKDDIVAKGETIAAVGSTGRSTGNHLHFSVRLKGNYVSPWNYIS